MSYCPQNSSEVFGMHIDGNADHNRWLYELDSEYRAGFLGGGDNQRDGVAMAEEYIHLLLRTTSELLLAFFCPDFESSMTDGMAEG